MEFFEILQFYIFIIFRTKAEHIFNKKKLKQKGDFTKQIIEMNFKPTYSMKNSIMTALKEA